MNKLKVNVRLLRRIEKHILAEPRRMNMRFGLQRSTAAPCGTVGCIAGWAAKLSGAVSPEQFNKLVLDGSDIFPRDEAAAALKLPSWFDSNKLFYVGEWPEEFRLAYYASKTQRGTVRVVVNRIEHLIKHGE